MADSSAVAALREDLTIQQVILESLESEQFEGVEAERAEARAEIARLKKRMQAARLEQQHAQPDERMGASSSASSQPGYDEQRRQGVRHAAGEAAATRSPGEPSPFTPGASASRSTPAAMATPVPQNDIWNSPGSGRLPSRKRDFVSTNLEVGNSQGKSRRTTPTPSTDPFRSSPANGNQGRIYDVIDLTGDDVDEDSSYLTEHIKEEQRWENVKRDRDMALQMSQGPYSSVPPLQQHQNDALSRLMATQRANAPTPGEPSQLPSFSASPSSQSVKMEADLNRPMASSYRMPGSFDPSWDQPVGAGSALSTPNVFPKLESPIRHGQHARHGHGPAIPPPGQADPLYPVLRSSPGFGNGFSTPTLGSPGGSYGSYGSGNPAFGDSMVSRARVNRASLNPYGMPYPPTLPSQRPMNVLDAINRTGAFDYARGTDGMGNALPDRLNSFIQEAYHDPRVSEKELDDLLKNIRPDMDIPEANRDGTPAGLKSNLYPHQELALSWMKKMEEGTNKGGILADDMGLGKTISTLALLLSRPATSRPKTNLIIGPVALMRQWEDEIAKKTKLSHRLSVFIYHNKKVTTDELLRYDVVLTTYGTIAQELKRLDAFMEENADRSVDFSDKALATKCPLLHPRKAVFYRVILDEAQCIKNKETRTAKACHKLRATYRWCLTGTPMMNGILELYSLLHFLKIKPYSSWEQFRQSFGTLFGKRGDPRSVAMRRLQALLKAIMLRRKKDSKLDGKPILRLPQKTEAVVYAELSGEELNFYKQLEERSQVQFSKYLRDGSIGKNYSNILVLLLRLRQACCHPHLNLDVDDVSPYTNEEMLELVKGLDQAIVNRIKELEAFECPICYDAVQSPSFFIPCGHDSCQQCLVSLVDNAATVNLQEGNESSSARCPVCRGPFDPRKCFTYDAFQKIHMPEMVKKEEEDAEDADSDEESISDSDSDDDVDNKGNLKNFIVGDGDFSDDEEKKPNPEEKKPMLEEKKPMVEDKKTKREKKKRTTKDAKGKKKASDIKPSMLKTLRKEAHKNRQAFKKYMGYLRRNWLPAAKVTECMRLLSEIQETGEKTIVFSQWTLLLDLLEVAMWHEGIRKPQRYDGSMSANERDRAAVAFRDDRSVTTMLVSLRAGNAGLNLTSASRVIIMDPFWNPYIEMQAVDRAYRIGQKREVKVYRILTKETIEDRIVELQDRKKEIVEAALDEKQGQKVGRLSTSELKFLFNTRG